MKIGIIGAGNIGSALAGHFHRLHHTVFIANSRGPETLSAVARETGANPVPITEVANGVDLLIITIPLKGVPSLPRNLLFNLDTSSPIIDTGMASSPISRILTSLMHEHTAKRNCRAERLPLHLIPKNKFQVARRR